ncbi:transmembrane protein 18-domain-containing protein [Gaertneriomyces semiglobifer]|nr:transmembrane protein 18-domain-containing protein [Gaertneriomyces semiglobifer]
MDHIRRLLGPFVPKDVLPLIFPHPAHPQQASLKQTLSKPNPAAGKEASLSAAWSQITEDGSSFLTRVDFNDPFILSIVGFHLCMGLWVLATRSSYALTVFNLFLLSGMILLTSSLQKYSHLLPLPQRTYFEDSGAAFVLIFWAAPLLAYLVIVVFVLMGKVVSSMTELRQKQMQTRKRK